MGGYGACLTDDELNVGNDALLLASNLKVEGSSDGEVWESSNEVNMDGSCTLTPSTSPSASSLCLLGSGESSEGVKGRLLLIMLEESVSAAEVAELDILLES